MKIVIPMSGFGERFRSTGYAVPKPLIVIEGKPMIEHVCDMFPGENDFVFVCNQDHLANPEWKMRETLERIAPRGRIVSIKAHKLGPVFAVQQAFSSISDDEPVIVNYCDFTCYWDFKDFLNFVQETGSDAAIPCYRGFHPHMLGTTNYAFLRHEGLWATDIKEKEPFTEDRMSEFASSGTFYFSTGRMLKRCFNDCVTNKVTVNDEFYVSMAMRPLMQDGSKVSIYELQHFMQWGTPEDVREYQQWSKVFRDLTRVRAVERTTPGTLLLPMAGLGSRFANEGYTLTKPLIPVSGKPMVVQASLDLCPMQKQVFVLRKDMPGIDDIVATLQQYFPGSRQVLLDKVTDGQARTCLMGMEGVDVDAPLTIGACDNGVIYDAGRFEDLMKDENTDVIVWAMRGYPGAQKNPKAYGWLEVDGDVVTRASVKVPLGNPASDPIIIGAFTFKKAADFLRAADHLIESGVRVNGEIYVDSLLNDAIELGMKVKTLEIDDYLCWGTPNDLRTFEYWQSCFSKWSSHPYTLHADARIDPKARAGIADRYKAVEPTRPLRFNIAANH